LLLVDGLADDATGYSQPVAKHSRFCVYSFA
jgi:hypothetical protein